MASAQLAVLLALTKDEADTLLSVLAKVGGSPSLSRRRFIDPIFEELRKSGFEYDTRDIEVYRDGFNFENEPAEDALPALKKWGC